MSIISIKQKKKNIPLPDIIPLVMRDFELSSQRDIAALRVFLENVNMKLCDFYLNETILYGGAIRDTIAGKTVTDYDLFIDVASSRIFRNRLRKAKSLGYGKFEGVLVEIMRDVNRALNGSPDDVIVKKFNEPIANHYTSVIKKQDSVISIQTEYDGKLLDVRIGATSEVLGRIGAFWSLLSKPRITASVIAAKGNDTISAIAMSRKGSIQVHKDFMYDVQKGNFRLCSDQVTLVDLERFKRLSRKYTGLKLIK